MCIYGRYGIWGALEDPPKPEQTTTSGSASSSSSK